VIASCSSAVEEEKHGQLLLAAERAPSLEARAALEKRRERLLSALVPARPEALLRQLGLLSGLFPSFGAGDEAVEMLLAAQVAVLSKLPLWAVEAAVLAFLGDTARTAWKNDRAPTVTQIAAEARIVRPVVVLEDGRRDPRSTLIEVQEELGKVRRILGATVYGTETTPEQRQEALNRWAEIKRQMAAAAQMPEPLEPGPEPDPIPAAPQPEGGEA
jgi:hypothetical protein